MRAPVLGLTGGTGCGKSVAALYFKEHGAHIIDADAISRMIMQPGHAALVEVAANFPGVLRQDGTLDRKKLGKIVFSDEKKLNKLNAVTHKYIIAEIEAELAAHHDVFTVIDAPLLFETNLDRLCDACLCVLADSTTRKKRIMARDGLTEEDAAARIAAQPADDYYLSQCRFVLYNTETVDALHHALDSILKELICEN